MLAAVLAGWGARQATPDFFGGVRHQGLHWSLTCIRPPSLKKSWCHESTESWLRMEDDRGSQSMADAVGQKNARGKNWCHGSVGCSFREEDDRGSNRTLLQTAERISCGGRCDHGGSWETRPIEIPTFYSRGWITKGGHKFRLEKRKLANCCGPARWMGTKKISRALCPFIP